MSASYRLPSRAAPLIFAATMSGIMSFLVSGVATWKAIGITADFVWRWLAAWANAWPIAFATLLVVAPLVRRIVAAVVAPSDPAGSLGASSSQAGAHGRPRA
jgi:hypothetical protein